MRRVSTLTTLAAVIAGALLLSTPAATACSPIPQPTASQLIEVTRGGSPKIVLLDGEFEETIHPLVAVQEQTTISDGPFGSVLVLTRHWGEAPATDLFTHDTDDHPEDTCGSQAPDRGTKRVRAVTEDGRSFSISSRSLDVAELESVLGPAVTHPVPLTTELAAAWASWGPVWLLGATAVLVVVFGLIRWRRTAGRESISSR